MNPRDLRRSVSLTTLLLVVAACSGAATSGWTYAPVASTPEASPSPSAVSPSASAASGAPAADVIRIAADDIAFDKAELRAPADRPFSIVFENREQVPHNVAIYTDESAVQSLFVGEIFSGPDERTYGVPALAAASYFYRCDVHPIQMTGTLIVQ